MNIEDKLASLEDKVHKLTSSIEELSDALTGNKLTKDKGLIDRIILLEGFVEKFNKKKMYWLGYASAVTFVIGFIIALIKFGFWIAEGINNLKP